jgi:hypothetical protein
VLTASVQVHIVLEPEPCVGLFDVGEQYFSLYL